MSKKYIILALVLSMLIPLVLMPQALATGSGTNPPANGYGTWYIDEGAGAFPSTLDPANEYDTASGECIFNSIETAIFFLGENPDKFETMLATQVTVAPPDPASPAYTNFTVYFKIRSPANGNPAVPFQNRCRTDYPANWGNYFLSTDDVEYSWERFLVHDYIGAATWMFYEFTLDCHTGDPTQAWWAPGIDNAIQKNNTHVWINVCNQGRSPRTATPSFAPVNMFIDPATGLPKDDGTFDANIYTKTANYPLDYPLRILFQVIAQSWCGIISHQWVIDYINNPATWAGYTGGYPPHPSTGSGNTQADWPGNTDPYADWVNYWGWTATDSPLDKLPIAAPTPGIMCGTGQYTLDWYDAAAGWSSVWYMEYWAWWPENPWWYPDEVLEWTGVPSSVVEGIWPRFGSSGYPKIPYTPQVASEIDQEGRITRLVIINTRNTAQRIADFVAGTVDNSAVSRANAWHLHDPEVVTNRNGPTKEGLRVNYPIPTLQVESQHYTFIVDPAGGLYGNIYDNDTLGVGGIPANFFNNTHVRNAFTILWNFTYCIQTLMFGEAYQPKTCAPDGLPYVNPANPMWTDSVNDEALAKAELDQAVFNGVYLNTTGFTVDLCYYDAAGGIREASVLDLEAMINKIGTDYGLPYHATHTNIPWNDFIPAIDAHLCATFRVGWLADYVDIHDFLFPYAASEGTYGKAQRIGAYHNEVDVIDADLKDAARTPDGPVRQALYYDAEAKLYTLNPTVFILVPIGRGYQRVWDQGFALIYMSLMPGLYGCWLWKWLYLRGDVDYDGKVTMGDVVYILDAFGSYIGKSGMPVIHPRWNYHCDVDGNPQESSPAPGDGGWRDRKIDMYDVTACLANFGRQRPTWEIYPKVTPATGHAGTTYTVSCLFQGGYGGNPAAYTYQWYDNSTGTFQKIVGATASTYTPAAGPPAGTVYALFCEVSDGVQWSRSGPPPAYITP
jgi:hypothetical protein